MKHRQHSGSQRMSALHDQGTLRVFATVLGRGLDTPYVLVEDAKADQFVVTPAVFECDWDALERGDVVELITTDEPVCRVLRARLLCRRGPREVHQAFAGR